ncbi:nucleotide-binding protein [Zhihengliuella halotolerans]|uniref:nucleotide-binding protein n=1 Tax=Zhihengliuella halotolerans TaxID=370736 RepID=UPI000C80130A|nr:hypothetical protein [Zhihengliuella halotolerans]
MSEKSQNQRSDEEPEESGPAEVSGEIDVTTAAGVVAPRTGRQEDADTVVGAGPAGHAPMDAMNFRTPEEAAGDATQFPARDAPVEPSGLDNSADADEPVENGHATGAGGSATPEPAAALTADRLLAPRDRAPAAGWRRWLYQATLGRVNVGDSDAVRLRRLRENAIKAQLSGGTKYVTVLSRKGGVGKTTATTLLGMALAEVREDRIAALDANPDRGTLSDRSPGQAIFTARQLVQNRYLVDSFAKISQYAARQGSRLHVLASDTDPHVAEAFDDSDYRAVTELMGKFYSIVLTDSGTGMVHSVMQGSLEKSDMVVLVSGASVDEARLASETLSWLEAHGRQDLARNAIVVINQSAGLARGVDVDEIEAHFASRVDSVVRLPYDPHLAEGSEVSLERLRPTTREAVMELAALVVDELRDAR